MAEWQPIESAPKDGTLVLLYLPKPLAAWGDAEGGVGPLERSHVVMGWYDNETGYYSDSDLRWEVGVTEAGTPDTEGSYFCFPIRVAPTHWLPLPPPPSVPHPQESNDVWGP